MTYNIQAGFPRDNRWDLEGTAAAIEAVDPDVVLLQEVGRGWPLMTGVDGARWLSDRLDMNLVCGAGLGRRPLGQRDPDPGRDPRLRSAPLSPRRAT